MIGRNIARKVTRNLTHPIGLGWSLGTTSISPSGSDGALGIIGGNVDDTGAFVNQAKLRGFNYPAFKFEEISNFDKIWHGVAGQNIAGTDYSAYSSVVPRKANGYPKDSASAGDGGASNTISCFLADYSSATTGRQSVDIVLEGSFTGQATPANSNNTVITTTGAVTVGTESGWPQANYGYNATLNITRFKLTILAYSGSGNPQDTYFNFSSISSDFADVKLIPCATTGLPWNTTEIFTPQFKAFFTRVKGGYLRPMDMLGTSEGAHDVDWNARYKDVLGPIKGDFKSLETIVALCNALGMGLWYTIPHGASDAYITTALTYIRDTLVKDCIYEVSNEIWNPGSAYNGYDIKHLINPLLPSYKSTLNVFGGFRVGTKDVASIVTTNLKFTAASGTSGTNQITATFAPSKNIVGLPISGTGIPVPASGAGNGSTYVTDVTGSVVTLSQNLTTTASGVYSFPLVTSCRVTLVTGKYVPGAWTVGTKIAVIRDTGALGCDFGIEGDKRLCTVDNSGASGFFEFLNGQAQADITVTATGGAGGQPVITCSAGSTPASSNIGRNISGTNIPLGSYITNIASGQITINQNLSGTASGSMTISDGIQSIANNTSYDVYFADLLPAEMMRQNTYFNYVATTELKVRAYASGQITNANLAGTALTIKFPSYIPHGKVAGDIGNASTGYVIGLGATLSLLTGKFPITAVDTVNNTLTVTVGAGTNGAQRLDGWNIWLVTNTELSAAINIDGGAKNDYHLTYAVRRLKQASVIAGTIFTTNQSKAKAVWACQLGAVSSLSAVMNRVKYIWGTSWLYGIAGAPYSASDCHAYVGNITSGSNVITNVDNVNGVWPVTAGITVGADIKVYTGTANFTGTRQVTAFDPVAKTITFSGTAAASSRSGAVLGVYCNTVTSVENMQTEMSIPLAMRLGTKLTTLGGEYNVKALCYEAWFDNAQDTGVAVTYGTTGGVATIAHAGNDMVVGDRAYYVPTGKSYSFSGTVLTRDNNGYTLATQEQGTVAGGTVATVFPPATYNSRASARTASNNYFTGLVNLGIEAICPFQIGANLYSGTVANMPYQWVGTENLADVFNASTYGKMQGLDDAIVATRTFTEVPGVTSGYIFFDDLYPVAGDNAYNEWLTVTGTPQVYAQDGNSHSNWYWSYSNAFGSLRTQFKVGCTITCDADKVKALYPTAATTGSSKVMSLEVDGVQIATFNSQVVTNVGNDNLTEITTPLTGTFTPTLTKGQHTVVIKGPSGNIGTSVGAAFLHAP